MLFSYILLVSRKTNYNSRDQNELETPKTETGPEHVARKK